MAISPSPKRTTLPALSRAHAVVRQWKGDIAFSSAPDAAMFLIYLPYCPNIDWERELILSGESQYAAGTSYRDLVDQHLVDLLLAEISLPDPGAREIPDPEPLETESQLLSQFSAQFLEKPLP